ncbi:hypothetical protein Ancab_011538 [Ancistrocladus abbreviatus]
MVFILRGNINSDDAYNVFDKKLDRMTQINPTQKSRAKRERENTHNLLGSSNYSGRSYRMQEYPKSGVSFVYFLAASLQMCHYFFFLKMYRCLPPSLCHMHVLVARVACFSHTLLD